MTSKSFSVRGYAQSSLLCVAELYGGTEEIGEDESGLRALAQAWKQGEGDRILVSVESAQAVAQGLNDYSNIDKAQVRTRTRQDGPARKRGPVKPLRCCAQVAQ